MTQTSAVLWARPSSSSSRNVERVKASRAPSGEDDPAAWKQVLSALDFRDPRRSQAAAQVGRLRGQG